MPDDRQDDPQDEAPSARERAERQVDPRRPLGTTDWAILFAGE